MLQTYIARLIGLSYLCDYIEDLRRTQFGGSSWLFSASLSGTTSPSGDRIVTEKYRHGAEHVLDPHTGFRYGPVPGNVYWISDSRTGPAEPTYIQILHFGNTARRDSTGSQENDTIFPRRFLPSRAC